MVFLGQPKKTNKNDKQLRKFIHVFLTTWSRFCFFLNTSHGDKKYSFAGSTGDLFLSVSYLFVFLLEGEIYSPPTVSRRQYWVQLAQLKSFVWKANPARPPRAAGWEVSSCGRKAREAWLRAPAACIQYTLQVSSKLT